jgi:hypothetical protein
MSTSAVIMSTSEKSECICRHNKKADIFMSTYSQRRIYVDIFHYMFARENARLITNRNMSTFYFYVDIMR